MYLSLQYINLSAHKYIFYEIYKTFTLTKIHDSTVLNYFIIRYRLNFFLIHLFDQSTKIAFPCTAAHSPLCIVYHICTTIYKLQRTTRGVSPCNITVWLLLNRSINFDRYLYTVKLTLRRYKIVRADTTAVVNKCTCVRWLSLGICWTKFDKS